MKGDLAEGGIRHLFKIANANMYKFSDSDC